MRELPLSLRGTAFVGALAIIASVPTRAWLNPQVPSGALTCVLLDVAGDGIKLTTKEDGVTFSIKKTVSFPHWHLRLSLSLFCQVKPNDWTSG